MIQNSILVDRPIDAVFDYAAQFERHPGLLESGTR